MTCANSPAISIITALQDGGARIHAFDPEGMDQARLVLEDLTFFYDPYSCCDKADALVIVTEWDAFRALDLDRIRLALAAPVMVDLRNIYDPAEMIRRGFSYTGVGRGAVQSSSASGEGGEQCLMSGTRTGRFVVWSQRAHRSNVCDGRPELFALPKRPSGHVCRLTPFERMRI